MNSPDPENLIKYLADLFKDTREELNRVDSKAALLLAAIGVVVGAFLGGLLGGRWTPLALDSRIGWIWWLGMAATAIGIYSIGSAVYPHIQRHTAGSTAAPAYYSDVAAYKDVNEFRKAIEQAPSPQERLIDQTFQLAQIVQHKYILLQRGLHFVLLGILGCVAAIIINIPLRS